MFSMIHVIDFFIKNNKYIYNFFYYVLVNLLICFYIYTYTDNIVGSYDAQIVFIMNTKKQIINRLLLLVFSIFGCLFRYYQLANFPRTYFTIFMCCFLEISDYVCLLFYRNLYVIARKHKYFISKNGNTSFIHHLNKKTAPNEFSLVLRD